MKRIIELKHVGPKEHVRHLFDELSDRLEERLSHLRQDAVSIHIVFDENGSHKLYRVSLTCHIPGHVVVAHDEYREAGVAIREAFKELERQLEKQKAFLRQKHKAEGKNSIKVECNPKQRAAIKKLVDAFEATQTAKA